MRFGSRWLTATCAALALTALGGPAEARNPVDTPDEEITGPFRTSGLKYAIEEMDVAVASDGSVIAAFVEPASGADRLIVIRWDGRTGTWDLLSDAHYYFQTIREIDITVAPPTTTLDEKLYIAAHVIEPSPSGPDDEYLALISGPVDARWRGPGRFAYLRGFQAPWGTSDWSPSVCAIPRSINEYHVGVAFQYPERFEEEVVVNGVPREPFVHYTTSVFLTFSDDYGRSLGPARRIAGEGASVVVGLRGTGYRSYGGPCLASMPNQSAGYVFLAFEDRTDPTTRYHLATAHRSDVVRQTATFDSTARGDGHGVRVDVDFFGGALTFLSGLPSVGGGEELQMRWIDPRNTSGPSAHGPETLLLGAVSPADVRMFEGQAHLACYGVLDNQPGALGVFALTVDGRSAAPIPQAVQVADRRLIRPFGPPQVGLRTWWGNGPVTLVYAWPESDVVYVNLVP